MFFWHPRLTFDISHYHSQHKHHDLPRLSSLVVTSSDASPYEVSLNTVPEKPQELPLVRWWLVVLRVSSASICATCALSMVRHDYSLPSTIESSSTNAPSYVRAGGVHGGACGQAFPSEKGNHHPWRQPLRARPWPQSARHGPNVRD